MHAIFFGIKRAYYATLKLTRRKLKAMGLTAARFDLMYLVQRGIRDGAVFAKRQSDIWRALGVSPPVVSRMLRSLEKLGLVRRERQVGDGRQRLVTLTEEGTRRIRKAMRRFVKSGYVKGKLDGALAGAKRANKNTCFWAICDFESPLDRVRNAFGDTATLSYPWHPDD